MNIYVDIVVASWAVFMVVWLVSAFFAKRTVARSWLRGWWVRAALFVVVAWWLTHDPARGDRATHAFLSGTIHNPTLNALGAALAVVGVAFAMWARYHLGRNWGQPMTLRQEPELVVSGPYAWVRNPIYTGVLVAMLGSALINAWWFLVVAGGSIYFVWSSLVEERDMLRAFPDTYPAYKARTWRLLPYIF